MVALVTAVALVLLIAMRERGEPVVDAQRGPASRAGRPRSAWRRTQQNHPPVLADSVVLTLIGAAVGLVATWWSLQGCWRSCPMGCRASSRCASMAPSSRSRSLLALATSVLAGLVPALSLGTADLLTTRCGTPGAACPASPARHVRRTLVVAQVALAVTVVARQDC